jgi:hypothetical protein
VVAADPVGDQHDPQRADAAPTCLFDPRQRVVGDLAGDDQQHVRRPAVAVGQQRDPRAGRQNRGRTLPGHTVRGEYDDSYLIHHRILARRRP